MFFSKCRLAANFGLVQFSQLFVVGMLILTGGCGDGHNHHDHAHHDHGHDKDEHGSHDKDGGGGHKHEAKYGCALVAIGDHFAHLEFVFDKEDGKLTMHVWDGEVEKPVFLDAESIEVKVKDFVLTLSLAPVVSENAGWSVGHSPSFEAVSGMLKDKPAFEAVVTSIVIKGQSYENLAFHSEKGDGKH